MEVALNIESYWVMTYTKMSTGVNVSGSGRRRPWCNLGSERSLQHQPGPQCINKNREDHKPLMLHICVLHLYLKQHVSLKCQILSSKAHGTSVTQPLTANINVVWFKWSFFCCFFFGFLIASGSLWLHGCGKFRALIALCPSATIVQHAHTHLF